MNDHQSKFDFVSYNDPATKQTTSDEFLSSVGYFNYEKKAIQTTGSGSGEADGKEIKKTGAEEAEEQQSSLVGVLVEYSENTNFHGFRYIFAAQTFLGKFIWMLLFLAAVGGLAYQTHNRVTYFNSLPVNVNIEVKTVKSMPFPAVVMCNTNQYRMTVAEKMGLYNDIKEFYSSLKSGNATHNNSLDKMDFNNLTMMLAHQKDDFIYDCQWGSEKCGVQNFTSFVTDFGVCFAFNNNPDSTRKLDVLAKGATFGLHVVVNLEQYEYMAGPNAAAGIKILLYNESDFPRVRDLGLAIPPATNTLIAFKRNKVKNVLPPYGKCGKKKLRNYAKYAESSCEVECLANLVNKACGCRGTFMTWDKSDPNPPPYCTLSQMHGCLAKQLSRRDQAECNCPLPCDETSFVSTVSYFAISDFEASKQAGYISDKRRDIANKFRLAKVTRARLDEELVEKDKQAIRAIYGEAVKMSNSIGLGGTNDNFLATLSALEDSLTNLTEYIANKSSKLEKEINSRIGAFKQIIAEQSIPVKMFAINNLLPLALDHLTSEQPSCDDIKGQCSATDATQALKNFQSEDYVKQYIEKLIKIFEVVAKLYRHHSSSQMLDADDDIPHHLMFQHRNISLARHAEFLATLKNLKSKVKTLIDTTCKQHTTSISLASIKDCRAKAEQLTKFISTTVSQNYSAYENAINQPILALQGQKVHLNGLGSNLKMAINNVRSKAKKFRYNQKHPALEMKNMVELLRNASELKDLVPNWRKQSKEQLAIDFAGSSTFIAIAKAVLEKKDFMGLLSLLKDYISEVQSAEEEVLDTVENYYKDQQNFRVSETRNITTALVKSLVGKVKEMKNDVDVILFTVRYREFVDSLVEYRKSLEINKDFYKENFLSVSIYFQELQQQSVTQQEGYTWFSLLSDVGGTAGLFIGASFLSIIELLYFIAVKCFGESDNLTSTVSPE